MFLLTAGLASLASGSPAPPLAPRPIWARDGGLPHLSWALTPTGSQQQFRGLSPVSDKIAWVAGTNGTVLKTTNGGSTWASVGPALSEADATLQFRDIKAWSAESAVILSIGEATDSRVYITRDGGKSWVLSFTNQEATAFYDCLAFDTPSHGLAMSDPVDGKFRLIETDDGGNSWAIVDSAGMPPAITGEFGFAASGTCLSTAAGRWYLASGGVDPGRVFRSEDGHSWDVTNTSIAGGAAAGVFSVTFSDAVHGIAVGGDYLSPTGAVNNAAWSIDGGATWKSATKFPAGYRSGSSWVPGLCGIALAVGTTGSDYTLDSGKTWHAFDNGTFDSVECVSGYACWASGSQGRVARLAVK